MMMLHLFARRTETTCWDVGKPPNRHPSEDAVTGSTSVGGRGCGADHLLLLPVASVQALAVLHSASVHVHVGAAGHH